MKHSVLATKKSKKRHNAERTSWKGRSYKRAGKRIRALQDEERRKDSGT